MRPLDEFCCQNKDCTKYGVKDAGNITHRGWSGKSKTIRMLHCSECNALFSERKGSTLSGSRISIEKSMEVLNHIEKQVGIRQTARLTGVDKNTVSRLAKILQSQNDE